MIHSDCRTEVGRHDGTALVGLARSCSCGGRVGVEPSACSGEVRRQRSEREPLAALKRERGAAKPRSMGGDQRSRHIERHANLILSLHEAESDSTLQELRAALAERDVAVGYGGLWRFFARRNFSVKKDGACYRAEPPPLPTPPSCAWRGPWPASPRHPETAGGLV